MFLLNATATTIIVVSVLVCLIALLLHITKKKRYLCLITVIFSPFVAMTIAYLLLSPDSSISLVKKAPTITVKESLPNYIEFTIHANDNYSKVVIELNLADENKTTFKTTTLTGSNYVKGHEYTLEYSLSMSEMLTTSYYNYELLSYE